jgi:serine/threonine protein kinase
MHKLIDVQKEKYFNEACCFVEYAENGSLYQYIHSPSNVLAYEDILRWAKEIALGELFS